MGDQYGSATLTLQSRDGLMGALFQTSEPTTTLVDFGYKMGNGVLRSLRLEGRTLYARAGSPSFLLGGTDLSAPTLSVGDTYGTITKLAVGSYTSPGTNALSVTGAVAIAWIFLLRRSSRGNSDKCSWNRTGSIHCGKNSRTSRGRLYNNIRFSSPAWGRLIL